MTPASPPPAPNPFRAPRRPAIQSPMPILWLGAAAMRPIVPAIGKSWIH
jgi:hypothetical protein